MRGSVFVLSLVAPAVVPAAGLGQFVDVRWRSDLSGVWSEPAHWTQVSPASSAPVVPNGPQYDVRIEPYLPVNIYLDAPVTLHRLAIPYPSGLIGNGRLQTEELELYGRIGEGARVDVSRRLVTWASLLDGGTLGLTGEAAGFVQTRNGSVIEVNGSLTINGFYSRQLPFAPYPVDERFYNNGTIRLVGNSCFTTFPFVNAPNATFIAESADFEFANTVSGAGTFIVNAGRQIRFGGIDGLSPNTVIRGDGAVHLQTGISTLNFPIDMPGVTMQNVNITLNRDVRATRQLDLCPDPNTSGTFSGGRITLAAGGFGRVGSGAGGKVTLQRAELINHGSLLVRNVIHAAGSASLVNHGTLTLSAIAFDGATPEDTVGTIFNHGLIRSTGTGGTGFAVVNHGHIRAEAGELFLGAGLTGAGTLAVDAGATLTLSNIKTSAASYDVGVLDVDGTVQAQAALGPNTINGSLRAGERVRFVGSGFNHPLLVSGDITAPLVEADPPRYATIGGSVTADVVSGAFIIEGPVVAGHGDVRSGALNGIGSRFDTLALGENMTINGTVDVLGDAVIKNGMGGTGRLTVNGSVEIGDLGKGGSGTLELNGAITWMPRPINSKPTMTLIGGTIRLSADAGASARPLVEIYGVTRLISRSSQHWDKARLTAGTIVMAADGANVLTYALFPSSETLGTNIELNDNNLIVDYAGATPVVHYLAGVYTGFAGGAWNGPGISSAVAAATPGTGIGYAESARVFSVFPALFAGETVDATAIVARYTLLGDANLDRTVDLSDFARHAAGFNRFGLWTEGDFNYDTQVTVADFALLAGNFGRTMAPPDRSATPVPAPAAIGLTPILWCGRRVSRDDRTRPKPHKNGR